MNEAEGEILAFIVHEAPRQTGADCSRLVSIICLSLVYWHLRLTASRSELL